jgi:hypothetical protein
MGISSAEDCSTGAFVGCGSSSVIAGCSSTLVAAGSWAIIVESETTVAMTGVVHPAIRSEIRITSNDDLIVLPQNVSSRRIVTPDEEIGIDNAAWKRKPS